MIDKTESKNSVCHFLKAKNSFGMLESGEGWHGIEDPGTTFWCIKTQGPAGPDNSFASAKTCVDGRKCFKLSVPQT